MRGLTSRQREVLDAIRVFYAVHGVPPSIRELGAILGVTSVSTTHSHVVALYKKGYLRKAIDRNGIFRNYVPVDEATVP
jgi:repressor LexA